MTESTLTSVWEGTDKDLLERMIPFYMGDGPLKILDATVNAGRFWAGSPRNVIGLDRDGSVLPSVVGDNRAIPFLSGVFDLVVYDPPHVPNQGRDVTKDFTTRFGLVEQSGKENGYSLSHLYPPFLSEAFRVLRSEGLVFAKIADYTHNHRRVWAHCDFLSAAAEAGFTACDCVIKVRKGPIMSSRWKRAHHTRSRHVYWIILRKSLKCEGPPKTHRSEGSSDVLYDTAPEAMGQIADPGLLPGVR